ncbi:haloalkane dehalogenase [Halorientalis marina]|uniref:haloalkane dehalogenase n=1 Tax=Halorientalis marina TaxID=2931976 RepID=UPI001FF4285F|nr:haloalkane dehalogenase [Halorientalis marina]
MPSPSLLRTPSYRFKDVPDFPYTPQYVDVSEAVETSAHDEITEALMSYVDTGSGEETFLCLHGVPTWSFLYRKMIPVLADRGRVIAPDFIGFGRSDKLTRMDDYTFEMHHDALSSLIETLDLDNITLVCQDWGGPVGLATAMNHQDRFSRLIPMNTALPAGTIPMPEPFQKWRSFVAENPDVPIGRTMEQGLAIGSDRGYVTEFDDAELAAYEAPFPDVAYKAGAQKWPLMVPLPAEPGPAAEPIGAAAEAIQEWQKPALVLFSDGDVITAPGQTQLRELIPNAESETVTDAGHFLQENKGEEVAERIIDFVDRTPLD